MNFFKTPRAIRTPFRNTEIMTARGFGKRAGADYGNANDEMESEDNRMKNKEWKLKA